MSNVILHKHPLKISIVYHKREQKSILKNLAIDNLVVFVIIIPMSKAQRKAEKLNSNYLYISKIPSDIKIDDVYPKERNQELKRCVNQDVKAQKFWAWKVLDSALNDLFFKRIDSFKVKKNKYGKWNIKGVKFSVSHSNNVVAVAVGKKNIAIDIEEISGFLEKYQDENKRQLLINRILSKKEQAPSTAIDLLGLWTKKESLYKLKGRGKFLPSKLNTSHKKFTLEQIVIDDKEYLLCIINKDKKKIQIRYV